MSSQCLITTLVTIRSSIGDGDVQQATGSNSISLVLQTINYTALQNGLAVDDSINTTTTNNNNKALLLTFPLTNVQSVL